MSLTPYQAKRLAFLASKAGISIKVPKSTKVKMTRKEKRKIEEALELNKRVVVTCRNGHGIRVFSLDSHKKIGLGMKNYHKTKREKVPA